MTSKPVTKKEVSPTTAAKRALKAAGYEVTSCTRGRGTAWGWITAKITGTWTDKEFRDEHYATAFGILKKATGREHLEDDIQTDLFMVNLHLDYDPRLPTEAEYAAMDRDTLEKREGLLRDEKRRYESYGAGSGPIFERMTADLAATVDALKAFPPRIGHCGVCADGTRDDGGMWCEDLGQYVDPTVPCDGHRPKARGCAA